MEEIIQLALIGDLVDVIPILILQTLSERTGKRRIRSMEFPRFNIENFSPEDSLLNFRFDTDGLGKLLVALNIPRSITIENRTVTGLEALCMYLRRLAYPNRLTDLERIFGVSAPYISMICIYVMNFIHQRWGPLLSNLNNLKWLNKEKLSNYSAAVASKNVPVENCWGFIDGTARAICRPVRNQEHYFSGHKRVHCIKYQSVLCPDGIIVSLKGPFPGRMHDAGILRDSKFYNELEQCAVFPSGEKFVLYGDSAYPLRELLLRPFSSQNLTPDQMLFNSAMSHVRQSVEWGFGKIVTEFAFLDFKKNQKLLLQDLEKMYHSAVILTKLSYMFVWQSTRIVF